MKRKVILSVAGVLLILVVLLAYVGLTAGRDLLAARSILSQSAADLDQDAIDDALGHLEDASGSLDSLPAKILGIVPIARQNIDAARSLTRSAIPVLQEAKDVSDGLDRLESSGVIVDGRIQVEAIAELGEPIDREVAALQDMSREVEDSLSGWLLPPVWDSLHEVADRATDLAQDAEHASGFIEAMPGLLGDTAARRYLVVFMNNAELRGSGGIPSGIGTLKVEDGKLELGRFAYEEDLADDRPYRFVESPPDFKRRFHEHASDSTLWVNSTFSPDTPEVAEVMSRLYELVTKTETDGVLFVDPVGIAALLGPDGEVTIPETGRTIPSEEFPEYNYSTAYEELGRGDRRRQALLDAGTAAFNEVIRQGFGGRDSLGPVGDALAGRHLMFVSFDEDEESFLQDVGVTGSLAIDAVDALHVTVQNYAADKLDYWMDRDIRHECVMDEDVARCRTSVRLTNQTPEGLGSLVAPAPYGVSKSYTEIYVPEDSRLVSVGRDGEAATYFESGEDGLTSYADLMEVPAGSSSTFEVVYDLDVPDAGYTFEATPQPLSHDASLTVRLETPSDWDVVVDGEEVEGPRVYEDDFSGDVRITAGPTAVGGLPALWDSMKRFWSDPLF